MQRAKVAIVLVVEVVTKAEQRMMVQGSPMSKVT